eukprot:TRINITY_DN13840_c0_g1_i1.p3 TRINITY_DN13840_c0_g1~~TRINITY_DN13840_c0_g1_i1.p3  ORF type:complete len:180 (-),score=18.68 TRINITY_DN13840_c0_g1_i1:475-1014(-)
MIRRPPRSTHCISSAASDVYKRQVSTQSTWAKIVDSKMQRLYNFVHLQAQIIISLLISWLSPLKVLIGKHKKNSIFCIKYFIHKQFTYLYTAIQRQSQRPSLSSYCPKPFSLSSRMTPTSKWEILRLKDISQDIKGKDFSYKGSCTMIQHGIMEKCAINVRYLKSQILLLRCPSMSSKV